MDEALYATCAREMLQRGDWVVPWFNGQMFPEKPPLMFWTMMAGFELFGVNELGARFFSAVFGVATALATFHLGRILFNARVGLWAGLITASTIIFTVSARAATVDSALTLVTTLAFLLFVMAGSSGAAGSGSGSPHRQFAAAPHALRCAVPMYACIGVAVLGKGPVGMVLPLAAMGLYLLVADGWRNVFRSAWWMRPFTAIVVVAAVALPWYVWVGVRTDGEWLRKFFIEFNLRPFKQPILGHGDASSLDRALAVLVSISYYFYHVPAVLVGFFPWSVFLGPTLVDTVQRIRRRDAWRDGCLLAVVLVRRVVRVLVDLQDEAAALSAAGLSGAGAVDGLFHRPLADRAGERFARWWLRNAWISMILVGVGMMIAVPIVAAKYLPGEAVLGLVGLIPLVGGGWCWWKTAHGRHRQAAIAFAVTAVVFLTAMFGWARVAGRSAPERPADDRGHPRRLADDRHGADRHLPLLPRKHRLLCRPSGDKMRRRRGTDRSARRAVAGVSGQAEAARTSSPPANTCRRSRRTFPASSR